MTDEVEEELIMENARESDAEAGSEDSTIEEREAAAEIEPQTGRHPDNDGETIEQ